MVDSAGSLPYDRFTDDAAIEDDVNDVQVLFLIDSDPAIDLLIGEFRTASGSSSATSGIWGQIKNAYRR